ncbi:LysR substrate-binding domain-containing protein [Deinococcus radiophilus]|uniref:LysR family transcriptional regulator n=1 Tax=Deinococcus radiophilus TaxID=32062 RepID=A0A3S0ICZ4_9DEIO|nr:LysR substrate-binding domain-containing protein [Deinococcus radiophilus]RTR30854.1 LysR family transcriptional regulator [Deinococcus radiophilus]
MELRHLRHFIALAEEGHFGRAAERVYVVQQALSSSVRRLEDEVGVPLVTRSTRRVELTPAGREFLAGARETLTLAEQTLERTRRAARGEVGHLTVGFVGGLVFGGLPEIVRVLRERSPDVGVELRELSAAEQEAALRSGQIDVGLMLLPVRDPALEARALWREPLVAALPAAHPLAGRERLHIHDLAGEDFVFFPRHQRATYFDQVMRWCAEAGFSPRVVQEGLEVPTLLSLVSAEVGMFLPISFFQRLGMQGVVYRPLEGAPLIDIVAVWRRGRKDALLDEFLGVAAEVLGPIREEFPQKAKAK